MSAEHDEGIQGGKLKCPCDECKAWRVRRARKGGRVRAATGDMALAGTRGQDGLVRHFREEVKRKAKARGLVLSESEVTRRAELLRNNHLITIQESRWTREKAS